MLKYFLQMFRHFLVFFSRSPKRTAMLDTVVKRRLPRAVATRWNFKSRVVNTVFEYKDLLTECLENIIIQHDGLKNRKQGIVSFKIFEPRISVLVKDVS